MRTVNQYYKDKFEAEVLKKIMGQIHERAADSFREEDPLIKAMIEKKMKEIQNHFDQNINVINAERKEQKQNKIKLQEIKEIEKAHEEYNMSIQATNGGNLTHVPTMNLNSHVSIQGRDGLREMSYFQDSLLSSAHDLANQQMQQLDERAV